MTQWLRYWPLPILDGRVPVISNEFDADHRGVDVMYARIASDTQPNKDGAGSKRHVLPEGTNVIATHAGRVTQAGWTSKGYRVVLEDLQEPRLRTAYNHLRRLFVKPGQRVSAGQSLGHAGDSPAGPDPIHVHFRVEWDRQPVDPAPLLPTAVLRPRRFSTEALILAGLAASAASLALLWVTRDTRDD